MKYSLNQLLEKYTEKNVDNLYEPVAVGKYGIRKRSEIFKKELADDYSKNKVIYKDTMTIGLGSKQIDFGILKEDMVYSVSPAYFTFKINTEVIRSDYLELLLSYNNSIYTSKYMIASARQGKKVDVENLLKEMIEVPDYNVQEEVVNNISLINQVIKKDNTILALYDELIKARFVEMFGDPFHNPYNWKKLKILSAVTVEPQNGLYKPQSDYVDNGSGIPILRIDGFYNGKIVDFSKLKRLTCTEYEKEKYLLIEDDIVINRVNSVEHLGKCAHITGLLEDTVFESNMMRMHFDSERFDPVYITNLLCSNFIYDQILNHAKKAVNQASINQKDVLDFDIYSPPIELQHQFAYFVEQTNKSKVAIEKRIKLSEELLKTKMSEYFMD